MCIWGHPIMLSQVPHYIPLTHLKTTPFSTHKYPINTCHHQPPSPRTFFSLCVYCNCLQSPHITSNYVVTDPALFVELLQGHLINLETLHLDSLAGLDDLILGMYIHPHMHHTNITMRHTRIKPPSQYTQSVDSII